MTYDKTTSKNIVPGYVYNSGEAIDGTTGITVGTKVLYSWFAGQLDIVPGVFKLRRNYSSSGSYKPKRSTATLSDISQEVLVLTEFEIKRATGKLIKVT